MREQLISYLQTSRKWLVFLAYELLFFTALNIGNLDIWIRLFSVFLAIAVVPFAIVKNKNEAWLDFLLLALPLTLFIVFFALSDLYQYLYSMPQNVLTIASVLSFLVVGYAMRRAKLFSIKEALIWLLGGWALLLAISLTATLYTYGFFYTALYQGKVIYVDGEMYEVAKEALWLFGFQFNVVNTAYVGLVAYVLASSSLALIGRKFSQYKPLDWMLFISGIIGWLAIVLMPLWQWWFLLLPSIGYFLFIVLKPMIDPLQKAFPRSGYYAVALVLGAVLLFFLFAYRIEPVYTLLESLPIINRFYFNPIVERYASVVSAMFEYPFGGAVLIFVGSSIYESTYSALFDALHFGGIFSALGYGLFFLIALPSIYRYTLVAKDPKRLQWMIIAILMTYFTYTFFNYQYAPFVRESDETIRLPFASELTLSLMLFLVGYTFTSPFSPLEASKEKSE